ncbi:MAG: hypothetical protein D6785_04130, partial [Planctomycetota bacterium]
NPIPNYNFYQDSLDVRQAYGDLNLDLGGKKAVTLRIGRQELKYGRERLIGGFNWNNVAQSFDAARLMVKLDKIQVDFFGARKVKIDRNGWNNWDEKDDLLGLYIQAKMIKNHQIHVYSFYRNTPNAGNATPPLNRNLDEITVGFRVTGKQKTLDYTMEFAYQFGKAGVGANRNDINALAFIGGFGFTCPCPSKPRLGLEINYASGDDSPNAGAYRTFDNLFPTNHLHYGFMDLASLQNLVDFIIHFSMKPAKNWLFKIDYHILALDTSRDNFYHAGRGIRRAASSTPASEFLGTELDITVKYKVNSFLSFLFGVSKFWAGDYLKDTGTHDNAEFAYFQTVLKF